MDWCGYCRSLEEWVHQQYNCVSEVQKNLENSLQDQQKYFTAQFLALKKYESEMSAFQSSTSQTSTQNNERSHSNEGRNGIQPRRYIIPHPIRRVVAECIDIFVMMILKLAVIYVIKNDTTFIDLARYMGFNLLSGAPEYWTLRLAHVWFKSEIQRKEILSSKLERLSFMATLSVKDDLADFDLVLLADQVGRFFSAIFEAILISRAFFGTTPGGATLGKWIMNLKVVTCEEIVAFPDVVEVIPGTNLGFFRALVRSLLKGTSFLTFFSLICMLLFQYHRCTYDIITGSLVVQPVPANDEVAEERPA